MTDMKNIESAFGIKEPTVVEFEISADTLYEMITAASFVVDKSKPTLAYVNFSISGEGLIIEATDTHRLAYCRFEGISYSGGEVTCHLDIANASLLHSPEDVGAKAIKWLKSPTKRDRRTEPVTVVVRDNTTVTVRDGDETLLLTRLTGSVESFLSRTLKVTGDIEEGCFNPESVALLGRITKTFRGTGSSHFAELLQVQKTRPMIWGFEAETFSGDAVEVKYYIAPILKS